MQRVFTALLLSLSLSACASIGKGASDVATTTTKTVGKSAEKAVNAPLTTLNLTREAIPLSLKDVDNPYVGFEGDLNCAEIAAALGRLEDFLGPDRDSEQIKKSTSDRASDLIGSQANSLIPFGSAVKFLSGADAHSKKVAKAVAVGLTRRGYLKGRGEAMSCPYPAAPKVDD